jgi:hypothetical protein
MSEQTTYVLNVRVTHTGELARVSSIKVDSDAPQAALVMGPPTLVDPRETPKRVVWRELALAESGMSEEDIELERLRAMARRGEIVLGPGGMPDGFWDMPAPEDPEGLVRQAVREDRDSGL